MACVHHPCLSLQERIQHCHVGWPRALCPGWLGAGTLAHPVLCCHSRKQVQVSGSSRMLFTSVHDSIVQAIALHEIEPCGMPYVCRDAPLDMKPTHIHEFTDPREVEITSRCCRVWVTKDVLDEEMVQVAERIIRAGMTMLHEPYMAIWWSSFLMDVRSSYQSGYMAVQVRACQHTKAALAEVCKRWCKWG